MKKSHILSLSIAMIILTFTSGFSANNVTNTTNAALISQFGDISYRVNINLGELNLCNTYLVELMDANGRLVAPAQEYKNGVNSYTFHERGPVTGVRVAALVMANWDHFICRQELYTSPAIYYGLFLNGKTYFFNLYPTIHTIKVPTD